MVVNAGNGAAGHAFIKERIGSLAKFVDETDGIAMEFTDEDGEWRFRLRSSNTEPVVRLNVEFVGKAILMKDKQKLILDLLNVISTSYFTKQNKTKQNKTKQNKRK
ncbi:hypothetical protein [Colwellia piezophila]|uniref:hypothetical protein n=1 Tax=Colwellia piezophila TaxID=211668 RepID=UPI00036D505B|nr:hypothetical protein [Colwellia piezophila]